MRPRHAAPLVALAAIALCICSCGGGSATTSSSETTSSGQAPGAASAQPSKPLPGHPKIKIKGAPHSGRSEPAGKPYGGVTRATARAAERRAERGAHKARRKLARKAGKAAPFLVAEGDNSIPTYGSEASAAESAAAEATLARYLAARAAGEWGPACAEMSAQVQKQLALLASEPGGEGKGCATAYAKLAERIPASARANPLVGTLSAFRVESPHGFALFYGPREQQYMMPLEEEAGAWKVTQIEPVTWPVGSPAH